MNSVAEENDARSRKAGDDCSEKIEQTVVRERHDRVKCVRVFDNYYRINWWTPSAVHARGEKAYEWSMGTTHCVRKSMFVHATISGGGELVIEEMVQPRSEE